MDRREFLKFVARYGPPVLGLPLVIQKKLFAGWYYGAASVGGAALCVGGELFCSDFETNVSWDTETDPEDASLAEDGDWTDQDSANAINDTYSLSIMGPSTVYVQKQFTESDEFNIEFWFRTPSNITSWIGPLSIIDSTGLTTVISFTTSSSTLNIYHPNSTDALSGTVSASTEYRMGIHYKQEYPDLVSNNGILRAWIRSDASDFIASDLKLNLTNCNTGDVNAAFLRFRGPGTGLLNTIDNIVLKAGAPSWPIS